MGAGLPAGQAGSNFRIGGPIIILANDERTTTSDETLTPAFKEILHQLRTAAR